jgi:hypothetical protein
MPLRNILISYLQEVGAISEKVSPYIPTVEGVELEAVSGQQEVFNTEYLDKGKVVREFNSYVGVDMSQLWALYQEMLAELITPEEVMTQWDDIFADLMKQAGYEGF